MSSTFSVPIASNAFRSHNGHGHGHGHTRSQHRRPGTERLPPPFALPRIPSERLYPKSEETKTTPEKDPNAFSLSNQRRFQTNGSISIPSPLSNTSLGTKAGEMDILPLSHPSPGVAPPDSYGFPDTSEASTKISSGESHIRSILFSNAILNALLIPLPFLLMPLLRSTLVSNADEESKQDAQLAGGIRGLGVTCALASVTLLLLAAYGKLSSISGATTSPNGPGTAKSQHRVDLNFRLVKPVILRSFSVGLPFYASSNLSGSRVAMTLLAVAAAGLMPLDTRKYNLSDIAGWKKLLESRFWILGFLAIEALSDSVGLSLSSGGHLISAYLALLASVFYIFPAYLAGESSGRDSKTPPPSAKSTSAVPATPWEADPVVKPMHNASNPKMSISEQEVLINLMSGAVLALASFLSTLLPQSPALTTSPWLAILSIGVCMALTLVLCDPMRVRASELSALSISMGATAVLSSTISHASYVTGAAEVTVAALGLLALHMDQKQALKFQHRHHVHGHHHDDHDKIQRSRITKALLKASEGSQLLHSILLERDSRRIFYFMCLNFAFMLVQTAFGIWTGSLGLLSDSIHMFFDCLALVVGLCAAVMSKWPPSVRFPYGYGKVDTLAGFANGVFLMIISIEIVYEALERLSEGFHMQRLTELLSVSAAGLAVNLVGIMCFSHAHHGHDHSHGGHDHGHGHGSNENMYGIYLHILADTMGSVAVVISTLLVQWFGWPGFDPLASCVIALLIFASAIPLVQSSAKTLLLSIPEEVEYGMRDTLAGVSGLRGVVGYTVPKFWLDDLGPSEHDDHDHGDIHVHTQAHDHTHHDHAHHDHTHHDHAHHDCDHHHNHGHSHSHRHGASHDSSHSHTSHKDALDGRKVLGVMHVIAAKGSDLEEVRQRTVQYLQSRGMDVVVQVEREGDNKCWCRGGFKTS